MGLKRVYSGKKQTPYKEVNLSDYAPKATIDLIHKIGSMNDLIIEAFLLNNVLLVDCIKNTTLAPITSTDDPSNIITLYHRFNGLDAGRANPIPDVIIDRVLQMNSRDIVFLTAKLLLNNSYHRANNALESDSRFLKFIYDHPGVIANNQETVLTILKLVISKGWLVPEQFLETALFADFTRELRLSDPGAPRSIERLKNYCVRNLERASKGLFSDRLNPDWNGTFSRQPAHRYVAGEEYYIKVFHNFMEDYPVQMQKYLRDLGSGIRLRN